MRTYSKYTFTDGGCGAVGLIKANSGKTNGVHNPKPTMV